MKLFESSLKTVLKKDWIPYVVPFLIFLIFTGSVKYFPDFTAYLYIIKTIVVAALLWFWRNEYKSDIVFNLSFKETVTAVACGILALVIWVVPEGVFFQLEQSSSFDPHALGESTSAVFILISVRLFGSAVIVPIMEELFWRSFLMRYLIDSEFKSVALGAFTWFSFIGVAIVFGLEHNRIAVGIIVGFLYGLLLIRQKKLMGVIVAHAITNLGLGIYVIVTGNWIFW